MKLKSVFSTWIAGTAVGIAADGLGKHFDWLSGWHSQYGQDQKIMKWLYSERVSDEQFYDLTGDEPRKGVFIELGAGDGLEKSNSLAFEEKLGWTGLLIEASPSLYSQLQQNRPNATCVRACAAGSAIEKVFAEDGLSGGTTAIQLQNENSTWISVTCQSLSSLIDMHLGDRGSHIDYLSLDVEGSELEILRSFNFHKHKVDVISIEVPDFLPEIMYKRLSKLLIRNGYRFLERIVIDEIWVRRRGLHPDPSCMLPLVELQTFPPITPSGGWGGLRSTLGSLLEILQFLMRGSFFNMKEGDPRVKRFSASVQGFFALWSDGDIREWEEQCPIGMLSLGLAFSLLRDRDNSPQDSGHNVMLELRQQTIFYYTKQLVAMFQTVRHSDLVKEFETAQEEFFFRMPLGNLWHLSSFEEILESGWPFFGLLALISKEVAMVPQIVDSHDINGAVDVLQPLSMPKIRCQLRVTPEISLVQKPPRIFQGKRRSTRNLILHADACNLLGTAASIFHQVRLELRSIAGRSDFATFDRLVNRTASCSQGHPIEPKVCRQKSLEECAALGDDSKAIPRKCLKLADSQRSSGVRLRRNLALSETRLSSWLDQGERLFRTFVERHGLFFAVWSAGQRELSVSIDTDTSEEDEKTWPERTKVFSRETLFDVLHSIQGELLILQGHSIPDMA